MDGLPPDRASPGDPEPPAPVAYVVPVIVHLSGARRGTTQRLQGETLRIGTGPEVEVHVAHEPCVASHHATLRRQDGTYELTAEPESPVWVNGQRTDQRLLDSGDVLEIGRDGPILRFRIYPPGSRGFKSPREAFSDCMDCARYSSDTAMGRAAVLLAGAPKELATQTPMWFRLAMLGVIAVLALAVILLVGSFLRLEQRLGREELRIRGIGKLLEESENRLPAEDLVTLRSDLSSSLERIAALEARTDAPTRVVSTAAVSVVLLQGAYGFVEPRSGEPLRFMGLGPDGQPLRDPTGAPLVGLGGDGPVLEAVFTGTAFVASEQGLLLTNLHVARPWDYDDSARMVVSQGLVPAMRRFIGYLPGSSASFDVELVLASDSADLAVLRCSGVTGQVSPLLLREDLPKAGQEVVVLGYPTGIRALLARADEAFLEELAANRQLDFWTIAQRLAVAGHIAPLASRGIVAQVSQAAVVYDAETTRGGSGGPVLDLDGQVIAVTSAIVPEFGGSNLGVPARRARQLLFRTMLPLPLPLKFH